MVATARGGQDGSVSSIWDVRRSTTDAKLAGLCGGVAAHFRIDPVLVRVAWVLLALSGGIGVVLYLAGWLLVPREGRATAAGHDMLGDSARHWPKEVWVALVVVACLVLFPLAAQVTPFGFGPALVIGGIWYFGFYKLRSPSAGPGSQTRAEATAGITPVPPATPQFLSHPGPATPFTEAAATWRRRIEQHALQHTGPAATTWPATPDPFPVYPAAPAQRLAEDYPSSAAPPPGAPALVDPAPELDLEVNARASFLAQPDPLGLYDPALTPAPSAPVRGRDRRSARRLRLVCLAVLGLTAAGLGFADQAGVSIAPSVYAATALLVVGLTLIAATWWGRAPGLLPVGLLLVPVLAATLVVPPISQLQQASVVQRSYRTAAELPAAGDTHPTGELKVDLRGLRTQRDLTYTAHVGEGRLEVAVPADVNVAVRYRTGLGVVQAYNEPLGVGNEVTGTIAPPTSMMGKPTVTLDLSVDRGELTVQR